MDDAEVIVLELLVPSCHSPGELLWGLPVCEVLVVHFDHKGFSGPNEVGPPVIYRLNHSEELEVVGVIVLLSGRECGQVISYSVAFSWGGWLCSFILGKDGSNSIL